MLDDELRGHLRMRQCLAGIRDLDPEGVELRMAEIDAEIERLRVLLEPGEPRQGTMGRRPIEIVPIGAGKAA